MRELTLGALTALALACRSTPSPAVEPAPPADRTPQPLPDQQGPVIGVAEPLTRTPYSEWERVEHRGLLAANGVAADRAAWRTAAQNPSPSLRAAACALLAETPAPDDRATLTAAAGDGDPTVRAWAALGLARLGEHAQRAALRALADQTPDGNTGALVAAGALARLGDASALPTIAAAFEDDAARAYAVKWLFDFARLPGADVWPLYARALRDPSEATRGVALAQLGELRDPRSVPVLEAFVAAHPGDGGQPQLARELLAELRR